MPEPTSTAAGLSLTALSIALLGPAAGPWALILFAALAGAQWPLSSTATGSRAAGAWLLLRCTLTSLVLTAALSAVLEAQFGWAAGELLAPVAFFVAALGNGWRPVIGALGAAASALLGRAAGSREAGGRDAGGQP